MGDLPLLTIEKEENGLVYSYDFDEGHSSGVLATNYLDLDTISTNLDGIVGKGVNKIRLRANSYGEVISGILRKRGVVVFSDGRRDRMSCLER